MSDPPRRDLSDLRLQAALEKLIADSKKLREQSAQLLRELRHQRGERRWEQTPISVERRKRSHQAFPSTRSNPIDDER